MATAGKKPNMVESKRNMLRKVGVAGGNKSSEFPKAFGITLRRVLFNLLWPRLRTSASTGPDLFYCPFWMTSSSSIINELDKFQIMRNELDQVLT